MPRANQLSLPPPSFARTRVAPQVARSGEAALVAVTGLIDELFPGFGELADARVVVIDLGGVPFMTSFGVRQWLRSMAAIPATVTHLYLLRCPTIIVDQLNMILNFGGPAKILSLAAPFICSGCSATSKEIVDVLAEGASIKQGALGPRSCKKCNAALELDDHVASYFACLEKYAATEIHPVAADLVANSETLQLTAIKPSVEHAAEPGVTVAVVASGSGPRRRTGLMIVVAVILIGAAVGAYLAVAPH